MRGFTLLEMLIVVAVGTVLAVIGVGGISSFRDSSLLNEAITHAADAVQEARSQTLSSVNQSSYGVHFATSSIIVFSGATYNAGDAANKAVFFSSRVEISNITFPDASVVFQRLTGEAVSPGSVTFQMKNTPAKQRTMTVYTSGLYDISR